ncbi:MAG TPA: cytochrome C peroxidase, partial [Gammaproteobacteria bacterium]|nr:cytochrome C peroxidase [Gammaproteobacteria bacterium]
MQKLAVFLLSIVTLTLAANIQAFDYWQTLPKSPIIPPSNPQTAEKIALGKQLFFDTRLSKQGDVSC